MEKHHIHIILDKNKWEELKKIAKTEQTSGSAIIRDLITKYLKRRKYVKKV